MIRVPREERRRRLRRLVFSLLGLAAFVALFALGQTGLLAIYRRQRTEQLLRKEVAELKFRELLLRSDLDDYESILAARRAKGGLPGTAPPRPRPLRIDLPPTKVTGHDTSALIVPGD